MTISPWCLPNAVAASGEARHLAQNGLHWLARLAHSFRAGEPGDAHLALVFEPDRCAFATKPFAHDVSVEMRLPTLEMQFRERGRLVPHVLDVDGKSPAQIEAWMLVELLHRGIDRDRFSKRLPYAVADLMAGDTVEFEPARFSDGLDDLALWCSNAYHVLAKAGSSGETLADVVCWPSSFVMTGPADARGLMPAFCVGNSHSDEPYFFLTGDPANGSPSNDSALIIPAGRIIAQSLSADGVARELAALAARQGQPSR